jgi:hypothetical protein
MDIQDWKKLMAPSSGNSTGGVGSIYKDVQENTTGMKKGWDSWKLSVTDYDKFAHERNMDVSKEKDFQENKGKLLEGAPKSSRAEQAGQQKDKAVVGNASMSWS